MSSNLSLFLDRSLCSTLGVVVEAFRFVRVAFRPRASLIAENLFLRKQLAFYVERGVKPRRLTDTARLSMVFWFRWFDLRNALVVVRPETLIRWHRKAFQLFWRWKCYGVGGRPRLPANLRELIAEMVRENPTWGQERVALELSLKLGIRVSPRTVRAYWPDDLGPRHRPHSQRWSTFVRNHCKAIVACDFVVVLTAGFRLLYVLVVMEIGSRRILHVAVTDHPASSWTLQQLRESIPSDHTYRWLIHDRSGIFSAELDRSIGQLGIEVLKTPVRAPKANGYCERLIGSLRRECLDWFVPINQRHLRSVIREWAAHYNHERPHASLGPGIPDPPHGLPVAWQVCRHAIPNGHTVKRRAILAGLHHEYRLEKAAA